jgi:hypothetical protein
LKKIKKQKYLKRKKINKILNGNPLNIKKEYKLNRNILTEKLKSNLIKIIVTDYEKRNLIKKKKPQRK